MEPEPLRGRRGCSGPRCSLAEGLFRAGAFVRGALYDAPSSPPRAPASRSSRWATWRWAVPARRRSCSPSPGGSCEAGRGPAVLSRGYGATRTDDRVVSDGERVLLDAAEGGDEPVLLARRLPGLRVLCGPDRARLAGRAAASGADVLLLDDGFQHRAPRPRPRRGGPRRVEPLGQRPLPALRPEPRAPLGPAPRRPRLAHPRRPGHGRPASTRFASWPSGTTGRAPVESRHAPRDLVDGRLGASVPALRPRRAGAWGSSPAWPGPGACAGRWRGWGPRWWRPSSSPTTTGSRRGRWTRRSTRRDADGAELLVTTEKDAVRLPSGRGRGRRIRVVRIDAEVLRGRRGPRRRAGRGAGGGERDEAVPDRDRGRLARAGCSGPSTSGAA